MDIVENQVCSKGVHFCLPLGGVQGHMDIFLNNTKLLCLYSGGTVV